MCGNGIGNYENSLLGEMVSLKTCGVTFKTEQRNRQTTKSNRNRWFAT